MPSATEDSGAHLSAPWYVTGGLDVTEARELEKLAKEDPELALIIEEAKREAEADIALNDSLGKPSQGVWERIERSIESEERAAAAARRTGFTAGIRKSVSGFFAGFSPPQWQAVTAAAVAICVIQAGAITYLAQSRQPAKYSTASGPQNASAVNPAFIVSFSQKATVAEVNSLLKDSGASIISGPNADFMYHVGLSGDSAEKRSSAFQIFRSSTAVKLVLPEK